MKQAQSDTSQYRLISRSQARNPAAARTWRQTGSPVGSDAYVVPGSGASAWLGQCLNLVGMLWYLVTLPFRLVFWTIAWVGRLTAIVVGFSLMVVGMALWAGPLFFLGIPIFLVGLVLTLRCLD
jgi:hypothetical protein